MRTLKCTWQQADKQTSIQSSQNWRWVYYLSPLVLPSQNSKSASDVEKKLFQENFSSLPDLRSGRYLLKLRESNFPFFYPSHPPLSQCSHQAMLLWPQKWWQRWQQSKSSDIQTGTQTSEGGKCFLSDQRAWGHSPLLFIFLCLSTTWLWTQIQSHEGCGLTGNVKLQLSDQRTRKEGPQKLESIRETVESEESKCKVGYV